MDLQITTNRIAGLKEAFQRLDVDGDGNIAGADVGDILAAAGQPLDGAQLESAVAAADGNHDGRLEFKEVLSLIARRRAAATDLPEDIRAAFKLFDRNGDGAISAEEMIQIFARLQVPLTEVDVRNLIKEADLDGNGEIDFTEFTMLIEWS